jgi:hypothetical protein
MAYFSYQSKTSSFTAAAAFYYDVDTSGGAVTCTLPAPSGCTGEEIIVNHAVAGNTLTFNTTSGNISGQGSGTITNTVAPNLFRFISNGTNFTLQ